MALKPTLETLEGLHEEVAKLYVQKDGKFHLDLEDSGLKSALQKERERAEAAEKALKDREKNEADEKAKKEREELERKGEYEKLRAQDQEEIKKAKEQAEALDMRLRDGVRDRAAMEAISSVKGIHKALLPHVIPALEVVPDGDEFKVIVKANPGQKIADFVSSLKADMAWGFEGVGASGSGGGQPGTPASGSKARFNELMVKPQLSTSESLELARLGAELDKPKP